ncbi:MAG: DUF262 domain-containing protein, partial [Lachnoclostridium edouardi]|uniref:GmrSD restriction endonuclease domain-containing protein n=1 Tax=Lachnoclostridium edouardi TaxID=1926283 RepID=UPI0026DD6562
MELQPKINGKTVERAYEEYRKGVYLVNRRYQRKLVWNTNEKEAFIDSLKNGYPVPLFLFSTNIYKGMDRREIIDGMQRLNAVFGFIENEFTIGGLYFDLSSTALTKQLLDEKILEQKIPILDRTSCVGIASYELPFSVYDEDDPDIIDEVFRRINSNGKHLSRQEIRQAGATGGFAELVRVLSTKLRGDVSHEDILLLDQMKAISIRQDGNGYGINADDVFWVKQNIIDKKDLRLSMDEELVGDLVGAMVADTMPPSRVSVLDGYYYINEEEKDGRGYKTEHAIQIRGFEAICAQFLYIIDEIKKIFYNKEHTVTQHILAQKVYRGPRYFQPLFLTLYELLIKQEMKIIDYDKVYEQLDNIAERTMVISGGGGAWSAKEKTEVVAKVKAILQPAFAERTEGDPMHYSYATEIETLLKQSKTENSQYDFKQGIHDLSSGEKNDKLIKKIYKTLTAMGNSEKNAVGYVLVGVADNFEDAEKISREYGTENIKVGNFYITGIDGEFDIFYKSDYDAYFVKFKNALKTMPL